MRQLLTSLLTLLVAATGLGLTFTLPDASAQKPGAQSSAFPYAVKTEKLPNGLTVVRVPFNSPGLVAVYTAVRVGSRNEVEPGKTGFAHFFEHMMFRGTKKYPEGVRDKALAQAGWNENAFTTDDFTVYHQVGPTSSLPQLLEFESDRFQNLDYSEASFQTEAKAVLGEYHKSAARPELKMEEELLKTAFTRHPYQHTTLGFYADIQAMPQQYAYSKQFFERWYTPDNTLLFLVGDFDDAKTLALVREKYGPWKGKVAQLKIPAEPSQRGERSIHVPWSGPTLPRHLHAWHTPASKLDTLDAAIQRVLEAYLVGPTSDLHRELVLEKQIVESVGSWFYEHRDPFLFSIAATLKDEKHRPEVKAAFDRVVRDLVSGKVDAARVEAIKSNTRYGLLMGLETPSNLAQQLSWYAAIFGDPNGLEKHLQNLAKVTPEQLREFAKKHLVARNRTILTLQQKPAPAAANADEASKKETK